MQVRARLLGAMALASLVFASWANAQVVISQVNGNGGLNGDQFDRDFVELFNRGSTPVNLAGWSIQVWGDFGSASSPATPSWKVVPLSGTIQPGQYYLVMDTPTRGSLSSTTPITADPLPDPDVQGTLGNADLVTTANGVALMSTTTQIAAGTCPVGGPNFVDLVRYGLSNGTCFEGAAIALASGTSASNRAAFRNNGGCDDTNNSTADIQPELFPAPRNSATNVFISATVDNTIVVQGAPTLVTLTVQKGASVCNPMSGAISAVSANLAAFGLSASTAVPPIGGGVFQTSFTVPSGQAVGRYRIPISASGSPVNLSSEAVMRVFPPAATNDLCASPAVLSTAGLQHFDVNTRATTGDTDGGTCDGTGSGNTNFSVWFSIALAGGQTGALQVTENSSEDVSFSLHASCGAASSQCLQADSGMLALTAGTTNNIQVARETASSIAPYTPLDLNVQFIPTPANDTPCSATAISSFPTSITDPAPAYTPDVDVSCNAAANTSSRFGAWYTFTTPAAPGLLRIRENSTNTAAIALFTGACGSLSQAFCAAESSSEVRFAVAPSTTYYCLVSISSNTTVPSLSYDLTFEHIPTPANDLACGATVISTLPSHQVIDVTAAGSDTAPTADACTGSAARPFGVWYEYTAGAGETGVLHVQENSSSDVYFISYTSGSNDCNSITPYQCYGFFTNDDIFINLTPGTRYWILVSLQTTSTTTPPSNPYDLTFEYFPVPANDMACGALDFSGAGTFTDQPVIPAATADNDVSCNYTIPAQSSFNAAVWYTYLPTHAVTVRCRDTASDEIGWALFTGADCSSLSEIDCDDTGAVGYDTAYFNLAANTRYWFCVGKVASGKPFGRLNVDFLVIEPLGACCSSGTCSISTDAACTGDWRGAYTTCYTTPNYTTSPGVAIIDRVSGTGSPAGLTTSTLSVPDSITINDLKVRVNFSHAALGDLHMFLTSPGGTNFDLVYRVKGPSSTLTSCPSAGSQMSLADMGGIYVFDDQATDPEGPDMATKAKLFESSTSGVVPSGNYKPNTCLDVVNNINAALGGQNAMGTWTLTIEDWRFGSAGILTDWGLMINGGATTPCPAPCPGNHNGDGQVDADDLFAFLDDWFAQNGTSGSGLSADYDGNNQVDADDLFTYLDLWFANNGNACP